MKKILIIGNGIGSWIVSNHKYYKYQIYALTIDKAIIGEISSTISQSQLIIDLTNNGFMYEYLEENASVTIKIDNNEKLQNNTEQSKANEDKKIKEIMKKEIKKKNLDIKKVLKKIEKIKNYKQRMYFRKICYEVFNVEN